MVIFRPFSPILHLQAYGNTPPRSSCPLFDKHPQDDRIISFFFARIPCLYILLHAWKANRNNREPFVKTILPPKPYRPFCHRLISLTSSESALVDLYRDCSTIDLEPQQQTFNVDHKFMQTLIRFSVVQLDVLSLSSNQLSFVR